MARYDVVTVRNGTMVLDVQADGLHDIGTRIVIPLVQRTAAPPPVQGLNPVFDLDGVPHILVTQFLASVQTRTMGAVVYSLADHGDDILRALDLLLTGV